MATPRMTTTALALHGLRRAAASASGARAGALGGGGGVPLVPNLRLAATSAAVSSPRLPKAEGPASPPGLPPPAGLPPPGTQPAHPKSTHAAEFTSPYGEVIERPNGADTQGIVAAFPTAAGHDFLDADDDEGYVVTREGYKKRVDPLDLTFLSHEDAFKSKTTWEVIRGLLVFQLCSMGPLVQQSDRLMKIGQAVLGKKLFGMLMKSTFYGHFVAGEDRVSIRPAIHRMHTFGVKSILDYSVEEDVSETQEEVAEVDGALAEDDDADAIKQRYSAHPPSEVEASRRRYKLYSARTYFYVNEASCEKNMETFLKSIEAVADSTHCTGFSAIKLTALGRPSLLLQLSEVIVRARQFYQEISGETGYTIQGEVTPEAFEKRFKEKADYDDIHEKPEVNQWLKNMTYDRKGLIHLFSWSGLLDSHKLLKDVFQVPNLKTGKMEPLITALSDEEEEQFRNMLNRLETLFRAAKELDVRVMVDAEQTYFQPAINRLTMEMMKKFNKEKAIVFNTYQCYLKSAYQSLVLDMEQAARQDFYFGAKLVRGAYMVQERERAAALGYDDPINPNYEATTDMYHRCLVECMKRMADLREKGGPPASQRIGIMVASHNADTVRFAIKKMDEYNIRPEDRIICFGQLYGMCDNISFPLGQAGYSVYKYVPYGPVNEVLPYLSRRAQENQGMMAKLDLEKKLLRRELGRRIMRGELVYNPLGDYVPVGFERVKAFNAR